MMLRELAENSNVHTPLLYGQQRLEDRRFVLFLGRSRQPWATVVQRFRLAPGEVDAVVDEVRALLRRLERPVSTWEVGSSATPADLVERLEARGLVPDREPLAVGMVLTDAPPPPPPEIEVVRVESVADYLTATGVMHEAFGVPEDARARERAGAEQELAVFESVLYLAGVDGWAVAAACARFPGHCVVLNGCAPLAPACGRVASRALVGVLSGVSCRRCTPDLIC